MLEPLKQFICDTCGSVIENPKDGWVEWLQKADGIGLSNKQFRICHHEDECMILDDYAEESPDQYGSVVGNHLSSMLKNNKMVVQLLDMLYKDGQTHPEDIRGIVEMLRRLTIPYYEEAKQYFAKATEDGQFDLNECYDLLPDRLKSMIEYYSI